VPHALSRRAVLAAAAASPALLAATHASASIADIAFGVALVSGVATVILFLLDASSEDAPGEVRVGAVPTSGGLQLVLGGAL